MESPLAATTPESTTAEVTLTRSLSSETISISVTLLAGTTLLVDNLPSNAMVGFVRQRLEQLSPVPVTNTYYLFHENVMLADGDRVVNGRTYQAVRSEEGVQTYPGFTEHAYRIVFFYGQKYPRSGGPWHLKTILPNGTVDQDRPLGPGAERGLICYSHSQSLSDERAAPHMDSAWVWKRVDGTNALVQTWPTQYNVSFQNNFQPLGENPDPTKFCEDVASEFQHCLTSMFSAEDVAELGIKYCHSETDNEKPAYVGSAEALIRFLAESDDVRTEMKILGLGRNMDGPHPYAFQCRYVDGRGNSGLKGFTMDPVSKYVLYTKKGWETMACVKLLEHFQREADLKART